MSKVKVSREIFEALESFKSRLGKKDFKQELIWNTVRLSLTGPEKIIQQKVPYPEILDIAFYGYELKLSLKEELELKLERFKEISEKLTETELLHLNNDLDDILYHYK